MSSTSCVHDTPTGSPGIVDVVRRRAGNEELILLQFDAKNRICHRFISYKPVVSEIKTENYGLKHNFQSDFVEYSILQSVGLEPGKIAMA